MVKFGSGPTATPLIWCRALLEAMAAAGRAVITTDAIGCREAVTDGGNGLLIPPRNPEALAEAIERLLSDAVLRRRLARRGRERAEREFAALVVIGKTLALYGNMLAWASAPVRA